MSQRIGFCTTASGIRLAYATIGVGPALVYVPGWPTNLETEWYQPFVRQFLESLGRGRTLVRYDMQGAGLSDRVSENVTLGSLLADLEAIVEHLNLPNFVLMSMGDLAGPTAIAYAATHPERVSHLVLHAPYLRGADLATPERRRAMIEYTANFGFPIFEFTDTHSLSIDQQHQLREIDQASTDAQSSAELLRLIFSIDVSSLAPQVVAPTLVLHGRDNLLTPFSAGRESAARLPNAQFFPFEGRSASPLAHSHVIIRETRAFLDGPAIETAVVDGVEGLTQRESQVLHLLARGLSNEQIADRLTLSIRTIERHVANVYLKLNVHSRAQAIAFYFEQAAARSVG